MWKDYRKSILAFLGLLVTNVSTELMKNGTVVPTTVGDGLRWAITMIAGTWLVYQVPNDTSKQANKHLRDNGLKAVPADETLPPAPGLP